MLIHTQKRVNILTPGVLQRVGIANVVNKHTHTHKKKTLKNMHPGSNLHIKSLKIHFKRQNQRMR